MKKKLTKIQLKKIQCMVADKFLEHEWYGRISFGGVYEDIIEEFASFFPKGDFYVDDCCISFVDDPVYVYANDRDHPFLDAAYREELADLVREATYNFLKLVFRPVIFSSEHNGELGLTMKFSESDEVGCFNLLPRDIIESCAFLHGEFSFKSCSREVDFLRDRLKYDIVNFGRAIKYLEGFTAQDSEERGLSYCLRFHEDFDTPDKYQAWSPGSIPSRISDGCNEIVLCTAVSLVPNPKYFDATGNPFSEENPYFVKEVVERGNISFLFKNGKKDQGDQGEDN